MNNRPPPRRGLGRGLGSLIPTAPPVEHAADPGGVTTQAPEQDAGDRPGTPADWIGLIPEPDAGSNGAGEAAPSDGYSREAAPSDGYSREAAPSDGYSHEAASAAPDAGPAGPAGPARPDAGPDADPDETAHPGGRPQAPADAAGEVDGLRPVEGAYFAEIDLAAITPNPRQPRQVFDEEAMAELVHSVREVGLLQPVVVRPLGDEAYELIMGERRWRAMQEAGLTTIPAIVRETGDDALLRDALLENLHRAQLNPLEEAAAYQQLLDDFGCTHEELADRIGRSRPQITNTLRLLKLSPPVQRRVAAGILSAGHARTLLAVPDEAGQDRLAGRVVAEGISVRGLEELVAVGELGEDKVATPRRAKSTAPAVVDLAERLSDLYDTRVKVDLGRTKGRIVIEFASLPDLERIVATMDPTYTRRHADESS
jgi:ParB family chromosome partitioning protein